MAHKKLTAPSSGAADKTYGVDWNRLIDSLQEQDPSNPLTFNVDHHLFKHSTTNAAGDLLKSNTTRFIRFPRGTANQLLRTNAAGTDIEWATITAGTGDVTGGTNVGTGTGTIFRDEVAGVLNLKTLLAGSGMTITNNANDITLASTGGGSSTLDGLTDVAITSAARGDIIVRDATQYVNKAKGTAGQVLTMNAGATDPVWAAPPGGVIPYDYIIYKSGANTVARNTATGADVSTNTDSATVFNAVISTLNSGGTGGTIFVKRGTYDITPSIIPIDYLTIVGENREKTIIRAAHATENPIKRTGSITTGFSLENISVESPGNGAPVYLGGATRCVLNNCRFAFTSLPPAARIMVFLDDVSGTRNNYYNRVTGNIFEGQTAGQDTFGTGRFDWGLISHNQFLGNGRNGQAIGVNTSRFMEISFNTFRDYGNFIGMEGSSTGCWNNAYIGNTAYNCDGLKMAQEGTSNKSTFCVCSGNTLMYGNARIEDVGFGDVISNNTIARTTRGGIRGAFHQCTIEGNNIIDTNSENSTATVAGTPYKNGGIMLQDNSTGLSIQTGNVVRGNHFFRSASTYVNEPDGLTKTPHTGGILIGALNTKCVIVDNVLYNVETDTIRDHGVTTTLRNNDVLT